MAQAKAAEQPLIASPGWREIRGALVRELSFRDFTEAIAFVERLVTAAEDYLRRPDVCIVHFNTVRLSITNPNRAGITQAELRLAAKVDAVIGSG
jgi:4a-hydroxytetrahydrobiopterin dehydratase